MANQQERPIVDNPSIIEVYADEFLGIQSHGTTFHFTFATYRPTYDPVKKETEINLIVAARLVLSIYALQGLHRQLNSLIKTLEAKQILPMKPRPPEIIN